ncbi:MAG TPA: glycosyltransferase family 4 protein [Opitutaceae bacterium]|jgi:glycosyltransferase involved in cell wall biosynthesis|nr:glycosyltransferase family 4 protein [Opitutaceae bacterium]
MSLLISHPSVAPFVQQAARAFLEAGQLDRFITSVRYDPASAAQRWACRTARACGFDLEAQLRRRAVTELPSEKVESHPWGEILRLASGRFDRSGRVTDAVWARTEPAFDRMVARRVRASHAAVYGFEYCSLATFERARALGVRTVYDMPAPEPRFVQGILDREIAGFPELHTPYHRYTAAREEKRIGRRRAEWQAASLVIAASNFTRESFARAGLAVDRVRIVPYGAPEPAAISDATAGGSREPEPLRLLWAGTFGVRKGAHYLIEAWRRGGLGRHARLRVFGSVGLPERVLQPAPEGVEFLGSIPRSRLMEEYRAADALIFPTLCDGFGMVASEAWSRGTPVITTDRAGAADLLRPGYNGLLIPAASADAIGGAIEWCLGHRRELRAMREAAHATAANWQWSDYRRALAQTVLG